MRFNKLSSILVILLVILMFLVPSCASNDSDEYADDVTIVAAGTEIIAGDYKIVEQTDEQESIRNNWILSIYEDKEIDYWYLDIYDNKTDTGIYGPIAEIDKSSITVWYGPDYYTEMPSPSWKVDGDKFILEYTITDNGIELSNGGKKLEFKRIKQ